MKEINKDRYSDAVKDMKAFQVGFPRGNAGSRKSGGGRGPRHRRANHRSGANADASRNGASRNGANRNGANRHKLNLYLTIVFWDVPPTREARIEERFECLLCRRQSLLRRRLKRIAIGMGLHERPSQSSPKHMMCKSNHSAPSR